MKIENIRYADVVVGTLGHTERDNPSIFSESDGR